jgi:hypothetical protein
MPLPKTTAWFPARKYGWGWGLPQRWQGWVVIVGYIGALALGFPLLHTHPITFIVYVQVVSLLLGLVCWIKGEKPRWRRDTNDQ